MVPSQKFPYPPPQSLSSWSGRKFSVLQSYSSNFHIFSFLFFFWYVIFFDSFGCVCVCVCVCVGGGGGWAAEALNLAWELGMKSSKLVL